MNRKFLRMIFLVRTVLNENGKLKVEDIIHKIEKQFEAYRDNKDLRIEGYTTFDKDKKSIRDSWKINLGCDNFNRYSINTDFEGVFQNDLLNSAIFLSSLNTDL